MVDLVLRRERKQAWCLMEKLNKAIGLEMILVPGGSFLMGSPEGEPERFGDEGPQHEVTISPFLMGRYPVTQAQWNVVAGLPQVSRDLDLDPSNFKGDNRPVEQVSWYEAVEFCDRLSAHTNRQYRLPSEAEWEYACRAETTTPFHFGKTIILDCANYNWSGSYTDTEAKKEKDFAGTTPVGQFGFANAFGLYDMHGNVYEWCLDHRHESYEGAPINSSAWLTDDEEASRVIRGGSGYVYPVYCRSASRYHFPPNDRDSNIGFRVVCVAPRTL